MVQDDSVRVATTLRSTPQRQFSGSSSVFCLCSPSLETTYGNAASAASKRIKARDGSPSSRSLVTRIQGSESRICSAIMSMLMPSADTAALPAVEWAGNRRASNLLKVMQ